jgi:hypothetical protein
MARNTVMIENPMNLIGDYVFDGGDGCGVFRSWHICVFCFAQRYSFLCDWSFVFTVWVVDGLFWAIVYSINYYYYLFYN